MTDAQKVPSEQTPIEMHPFDLYGIIAATTRDQIREYELDGRPIIEIDGVQYIPTTKVPFVTHEFDEALAGGK